MGLYISLNRKRKEEDLSRFKSGFFIFDILFKALKVRNANIVFYENYPVPELNKDFKRVKFEFGLLESSFRKKIKELGFNSLIAGFEIEADLILDDKKFKLIYELFPRNKSQSYDLRIGILDNGYADDLEDIEKFYPQLRHYIFERILKYNEEVESKKNNNLFSIRRALISDHKKEFHNIDEWSFFYSKQPEDFINNLSYGNKEIRERLLYANRDKFAEFLKNMNQFVMKMYDYAEQSEVLIKEGSIAIIPKDQKSMKQFIGKLRNKVGMSIKKVYPNEAELERDLKKIFID